MGTKTVRGATGMSIAARTKRNLDYLWGLCSFIFPAIRHRVSFEIASTTFRTEIEGFALEAQPEGSIGPDPLSADPVAMLTLFRTSLLLRNFVFMASLGFHERTLPDLFKELDHHF